MTRRGQNGAGPSWSDGVKRRIALMDPQNYPEFAERLSQVAQAM